MLANFTGLLSSQRYHHYHLLLLLFTHRVHPLVFSQFLLRWLCFFQSVIPNFVFFGITIKQKRVCVQTMISFQFKRCTSLIIFFSGRTIWIWNRFVEHDIYLLNGVRFRCWAIFYNWSFICGWVEQSIIMGANFDILWFKSPKPAGWPQPIKIEPMIKDRLKPKIR